MLWRERSIDTAFDRPVSTHWSVPMSSGGVNDDAGGHGTPYRQPVKVHCNQESGSVSRGSLLSAQWCDYLPNQNE